MKKEYMKPQMKVVKLKGRTHLMAGSPAPGDIPLGAPKFNFDDDMQEI